MPIITPILGELDHEARTTTRVLERVPQGQLDWTPHPRSMSLGKLAWHIATIPQRVEQMLRAGVFDVATARPAEAQSSFIDAYLANLDSVRAYLETQTDEALKEPFTMKRGEQTLMQIPKVAVVRTILMNHTYHHRGQLAVYLRLLAVPVPAIYGTSADEGM
jgi:uncharacterized damage-inducible protein DinB